ncbi:UNVERIFIED_CONTAM: sensor histidine kinase [Microbacterium sp. SLM126]
MTLYVPVVVALLIQVPATIAVSWWTRAPMPAAAISVALAAASALALLAARRWPGPTVVVVAALTTADLLVPPEAGPSAVALAFAIVGAVVRGARVWALVSVGAGWVVAILSAGALGMSWPPFRIALATVGLALCFAIGEGARARLSHASERRAQLAERARAVEQEERTRIARDLHDVLAHSLSQIAVQSGVGLHLFDREPERAREALANIRVLSATGLDEVRGVLSFLRGDEAGAPVTAPLTPQPQLTELPALVQARSGLGLTVTLEDRLHGEAPSSAVQTAAYRIAQEALTNVVRHSAASRAVVTVERSEDELVLTITDDGSGIRPESLERGGLKGMRERAELADGTLRVDGAERGTTVIARLPWRVAT